MRVDLLSFQQKALGQLRLRLNGAISSYREMQIPQILSFTAPTGSGKTIIMAALVESVFNGDELYIHAQNKTAIFPEMSDCVFLWLSDSPELNEQSKAKFDLKADRLRLGQCVILDDSFKGERLEDGHVYFLNTQKLGVNSNLTRHTDSRQYTIWEVLRNTVSEKAERFIVIIDEAHRGAQGRDASRAQTIMQKFIKGSPDDGLPKMPVVIGMSATIERFNTLAGTTDSTILPIRVSPDEVRASGLLKDRIIIKYPDDDGTNRKIAVLQAAATEWKNKVDRWNLFCQEQHHAHVKPIFIVQVENGTKDVLTTTNLDDCIQKIEEATGITFEKGEVIHTFGQTTETLTAFGLEIPYIEPSKISEDMKVRVVFFKENLSTGWDCPRAETMVSFKRAQDSTYIAQLLGRVIRTPIHARVNTDPTLNDVYLFLPFFDEETVDDIVTALNSSETGMIPEILDESLSGGDIKVATVRPGDNGEAVPLVVKPYSGEQQNSLFSSQDWDDAPALHMPPGPNYHDETPVDEIYTVQWKAPTSSPKTEKHPHITPAMSLGKPAKEKKYNRESIIRAINDMDLTTYKVREIKMETYFACLMNLSALLTRVMLYPNAKFEIQKEVAEIIHKYADGIRESGKYGELADNIRSFKLHSRYYDAFGKYIDKADTISTFNDDGNVDIQFRAADATLGKKGIGDMYGKLYATDEDETSYMVDVILFANDESALEDLNIWAKKRFLDLHKKYRLLIANKCNEATVNEYKKIVSNSSEVSPHVYHLPLDYSYVSDPNGKEYRDHLYVNNATGSIRIKLGSSWEESLLEEERKDPLFLGWLRNPPRKDWSLAIPYKMNGAQKTAYPDFLIVKRNYDTGISIDILEPHDSSKTDNLPKAKGFVEYAKDNMQVNSIQLIRQLPDKTTGKPKLKRLDLSDMEVQEKVMLANNDEDLARIFEEKGFTAEYGGLFQ